MSLHKLTAGSGYDYLTRQVAALDATDKGRTGLASYYTERGESPGVWVGSGMEGIDGLDVGDPVTAEQMRALFGCGLHPLAELRLQQLERRDLTGQDFQDVMRLGAPFKIIDEATPFQVEVAKRIAALDGAIGEPVDVSVAAGVGTHPSTALVGGIAVWRAANGINPQDPRPTGGTQLESLPALWKQRLDRDVAWPTYQAADATADEREAGRTALSRSYSQRQHPYQQPERRPSGPSAPRRLHRPQSHCSARNMRMTPRGVRRTKRPLVRSRTGRSPLTNPALLIKRRAPHGDAARVLAALWAGPPDELIGTQDPIRPAY
jgi:hypothetical protein